MNINSTEKLSIFKKCRVVDVGQGERYKNLAFYHNRCDIFRVLNFNALYLYMHLLMKVLQLSTLVTNK